MRIKPILARLKLNISQTNVDYNSVEKDRAEGMLHIANQNISIQFLFFNEIWKDMIPISDGFVDPKCSLDIATPYKMHDILSVAEKNKSVERGKEAVTCIKKRSLQPL